MLSRVLAARLFLNSFGIVEQHITTTVLVKPPNRLHFISHDVLISFTPRAPTPHAIFTSSLQPSSVLSSIFIIPSHQNSSTSTSKRCPNLPTRICIHNPLNCDIQARPTNKCTSHKRRCSQSRLRPLLPPLPNPIPIMIRIVQPERARNAVGIPARKQTRPETDNVIEYRNLLNESIIRVSGFLPNFYFGGLPRQQAQTPLRLSQR